MSEEIKKNAEINDDELEQAAGGLMVFDTAPDTAVRVKRCGDKQHHYYDMKLTKCPVCNSLDFTCVWIEKTESYYK